MDELTNEEFEAANERGRVEFLTKPHAASVRFDRATGLITLQLYNGCSFSFSPRQLQGLENATDEQIEAVELGFTGYGLHWEELDVDFSVPGLMAGWFGNETFMQPRRQHLSKVYARLISEDAPDGLAAQAAE